MDLDLLEATDADELVEFKHDLASGSLIKLFGDRASLKNQSQQVKIITLFKDKFESCLGLVIPLELTSLVVYLTGFRLGGDLLSESKDLLFHIGNGLFLRRAFCFKFGMCLIDLSLVAVRDGGASRIEGVLLMDTWRLIAESSSLFP